MAEYSYETMAQEIGELKAAGMGECDIAFLMHDKITREGDLRIREIVGSLLDAGADFDLLDECYWVYQSNVLGSRTLPLRQIITEEFRREHGIEWFDCLPVSHVWAHSRRWT